MYTEIFDFVSTNNHEGCSESCVDNDFELTTTVTPDSAGAANS